MPEMEVAATMVVKLVLPALVGNRLPAHGSVAPAVEDAHSCPEPSSTTSRTEYVLEDMAVASAVGPAVAKYRPEEVPKYASPPELLATLRNAKLEVRGDTPDVTAKDVSTPPEEETRATTSGSVLLGALDAGVSWQGSRSVEPSRLRARKPSSALLPTTVHAWGYPTEALGGRLTAGAVMLPVAGSKVRSVTGEEIGEAPKSLPSPKPTRATTTA